MKEIEREAVLESDRALSGDSNNAAAEPPELLEESEDALAIDGLVQKSSVVASTSDR